MMRLPPGLSCLLLAVGLATSVPAEIIRTDVFVARVDGYHTYRIPAILRAANGDLLAFCEGRKDGGGDAGNIDLLLKRSTDGGRTWGAQQVLWDDGDNTCGNPCPVLDAATGTIWLLLTHNLGTDREKDIVARTVRGSRTVWLASSTDHGATWTTPAEITATTKDPSWTWYATGPGVGLQIQSGPHAGRLLVPCDHNYTDPREQKPVSGSHVIFSDDHGRTWQLGGVIHPRVNECQAVELFDGQGTLLMNMRAYFGRSLRAQSLSTDGGATWTAPVDAPGLVEPVCQASILRWEKAGPQQRGVWLFSNPADPQKRVRLTVRASTDDGATWPHDLVLQPGPTAYSCLVTLSPTEAGCLYESGVKRSYERITFARFSASDLFKTQP